MRSSWMIGLAFAFASGTAMAADLSEFDANEDARVSLEEYRQSVAGDPCLVLDFDDDDLLDEPQFDAIGQDWEFDEFDTSGDGYIDCAEYAEGSFGLYDADEDGLWDQAEWSEADEAGLFDW